MAILIESTARNYPPGTRDVTSGRIAVGVTLIRVTCTREAPWPAAPGDVLDAHLELSLDDGSTWRPLAGFWAGGGALYGPGLVEHHATWLQIALRDPSNVARRARARVTNTVSLSTAITVEVW